jgi:23S rRNA pseudouridine2605 synthase
MEERLQKLIAEAGIASRRHAEEMIAAGEVTVNGQVVTTLGTKADPARDHIKVRGRLINPVLAAREKIYVLLYKPRGYLTSLADPEKRPLVVDLLPEAFGRLHPVGRLDFNTEGLLILTNDGELTNFITSARSNVEKVYEVKVSDVPPDDAIERLRRGIVIDDARTAPAKITKINETRSNSWFEVVLREGRNQQIRRMFDAIHHPVLKLRRVRIGFLKDEKLAPGQWRFLNEEEVARLMRTKRKAKPAQDRSSKERASKEMSAKERSGKARPGKESSNKSGSKTRGAGHGGQRD